MDTISLSPLDQLVSDISESNDRHTSLMLDSVLPDTGSRSKFTTGAVRDASEGKGIPSLIPIEALRAVSKRFEDGATKYGRDNWKKGIPLSRYVDSLYRHLWQLMEGDTDRGSRWSNHLERYVSRPDQEVDRRW